MMNVVRIASVATLLLSLLLLPEACSKKQPSSTPRPARKSGQSQGATSAAKQEGSPAISGGGSSPAGTIRLTPVRPGGAAAPASAPAPAGPTGFAATPLTGSDRLMAMRGGNSVFPADYAIGPLQPQMPAGTEQGRVLRAIQSFFGSLAEGKIDTAVVSPRWKDELLRMLSYPRSKGDLPTSVRIGALKVEEDKAHAAVRMEKGAGRANGEVYLERVDGTWYISDIQADFTELAKPFVRSQSFDPAEWKSLMKE